MARFAFCIKGHLAERNDFGRCKECQREADKRWRLRNPEKAVERAHYARKWDKENPERRRENERKNRARKRDAINQQQQEWRANNKEKLKAYLKSYREKHPDVIKRLDKKWRMENPEKIRKISRRTQAARRACVPKWVDRTAIKTIYDSCPDGYHVDHIIPIKGTTVCGLHVPWNLQYLLARENIKKGNRLEGLHLYKI